MLFDICSVVVLVASVCGLYCLCILPLSVLFVRGLSVMIVLCGIVLYCVLLCCVLCYMNLF